MNNKITKQEEEDRRIRMIMLTSLEINRDYKFTRNSSGSVDVEFLDKPLSDIKRDMLVDLLKGEDNENK